jgi:SprB repeat
MPFNYSIILTGDCSNTNNGALNLQVTGDGSPYTISWNSPVLTTSAFTSEYSLTGLSAGTYNFNLTNSLTPTNEFINNISFVIGTGTTAYISDVVNTTCGIDNGSLIFNVSENLGSTEVTLYKNGEEYQTNTITQNQFLFSSLSDGVYYCNYTDYGGCYGETENVVIRSSNVLDYGLHTIDNPSCSYQNGKIYVTGITGTAPFTYLWSSNPTSATSEYFVTGLAASNYSVTVTDSFGCQITKTTTVNQAPQISIVDYVPSQPSCSGYDGYVNFQISGGTGPYFYLLSNGDSLVSYSETFGFSGLNAGNYTLTITDVALCKLTYDFTLLTPNSFVLVSETKQDMSCGFETGSISVEVNGGVLPYVFELTNNSGFTNTQTSFIPSVTFESLSSDTYTLTISDAGSACTYSSNIVINNNIPFDINVTSQSTYCQPNDGVIQVSVINETTSGNYYNYVLSNGQESSYTSATTYSFSGLSSGGYNVTVYNLDNCSQQKNTEITSLETFNSILIPTGCLNGSGGTISALIIDEEGPFNLTWSDNVNGQTGVFLTGLTAGTYYLTISGTNGCQTYLETSITCNPPQTRTTSFTFDTNEEEDSTSLTDFSNLLYNGYIDVTTGHDLCKLNSATFYCDVELSGITYSAEFYTTLSLDDLPTVSGFSAILQYVLLNITYIETVIINNEDNTILIQSQSVGGVEVYRDEDIIVSVRIEYDTSCVT